MATLYQYWFDPFVSGGGGGGVIIGGMGGLTSLAGYVNLYAAADLFGRYKMMQKKMENDCNPGKWVLI